MTTCYSILFYSIVLGKRDKKHLLVYIKVKRGYFTLKSVFQKGFNVTEIEIFEQEITIFHKHLNSSNKKTFKVKSFSGFSEKEL